MKFADIKNLLAKERESATLEFKRSTAQLKRAGETLCAFLNSTGGLLLIGVNDKGTIFGQEVTEQTKREIGNILAKLAPEANVAVSYIDIGSKKQLITLRAEPDYYLRPYTFDGKSYIRLESNTIPMPRDQQQLLSFTNMQRNRSWEDGIVVDAAIADLDTVAIVNTINEGIANHRIPDAKPTDEPEVVLKRLGLLANGRLTNAAIILFAENPTQWFPQCAIRMARFRGTDKREFIDSRKVEGNIFKIIEEAMIFAARHLPVSSTFETGTIARKDEPLFPVDVLREIFTNAVCHRDYSIRASISFGIYDDRIEVWSPGLPPAEVTFDNIKTLHESVPRNTHIAQVLYYRKLSETWGRGIEMIVDLCTQVGHPEPAIFERTTGVCVQLISKQTISPSGIVDESNLSEDVRLTTKQREILTVIKEQKVIKLLDILNLLKGEFAERTVQRELNNLKKLGLIKMEGFGRGAVWIIKTPKRRQKDANEIRTN